MTDSGKIRDEDSGLHDIRNLAAASRSRLSSRRIGTTPPTVDEDILSSASGSWKSIALPEPARMISLPELAELPSKADLKAQQKAAAAAAKVEAKARKSRPSGQLEMPAAEVVAPVVPEVAAVAAEAPLTLDSETAKGAVSAAVGTAQGATITPMIGSRISGASSSKSNKGLLIGLAGVGLAAAAGVAIYLGTRGGDDKAAKQAAVTDVVAKEPAKPTAAPIEPAPVAKEEPPKPVEEPKVVEPDPVPVEPPTNAKTVKTAKPAVTKKPEKTVIEVKDPGNGVKPAVKKEEPAKKEPAKEGDPDFEQLLKESGYTKKENDKPKLEKKSLAAGDFKTGMAAVAGKAQGCFKGTQGTAMVKLTIAPSGSVSKVSVSGVGAAEASCVQAAVQGASFPAWDGGPQSFSYSYLLSD